MRYNARILITLICFLTLSYAIPSPSEAQLNSPQSAQDILNKAVRFIGGEKALMNLSAFRIEAQGQRWALDEGFDIGGGAGEQSSFTAEQFYDVDGNQLRLDYLIDGFGGRRGVREIISADMGYIRGRDTAIGQSTDDPAMLSDRLESIRKHQRLLNPFLLLRGAISDPGLVTMVDDAQLENGRHNVLQLEVSEGFLMLFVKSTTGAVTKVTTIENDGLRRDILLEVYYKRWRWADFGVANDEQGLRDRTPRGQRLRFPTILEVIYGNEMVHSETRGVVDINPDIDMSIFDIPESVNHVFDADLAARGKTSHQQIQSFAAWGFPIDGFQTLVEAAELAPGVFFLTGGAYNSLAVAQDDGVVIVGAPLYEERSHAVMDWVESNIPEKPITHTIMSHHHTDHSGGARSYVAAGVAIVMHETAVPFFEGIFTAPSTIVADALAVNPVTANIIPVPMDGSLILESGSNPVNVYPLNNDHAEDMVVIEAGGVLFVADIYTPIPNAPLPPEAEIIHDLITELGLQVDTIAGAHGQTIPFEVFDEKFPQ